MPSPPRIYSGGKGHRGDSFYDAVTPHLTEGIYLNFASEETRSRVRDAYGPNYDRLLELKRTYDPTNLFRLNQNISPH